MAARVVTVTSGKGGVGKTTATANIGVALASAGQRVVCIDADIGLRNLDVVMGLENRIVYDLVDIVEGRCKLRQAMIKDKRLPDLHLIPAAQTRDKTAVSPKDMVRLADEIRPDFDWVVIDSPPLMATADSTIMSPLVDGIILVVRANKTPAKLVKDAIARLTRERSCGIVLNRVEHLNSSRYYYHYYGKSRKSRQ